MNKIDKKFARKLKFKNCLKKKKKKILYKYNFQYYLKKKKIYNNLKKYLINKNEHN